MFGFIIAAVAGAAMSIQGVFNTRLSEQIGLYESNLFVQGVAFALAIPVVFFFGKGSFSTLLQVNKLYWLGGVLGLIITVTVMIAIGSLSPTVAISIILISQLFVAALIDAFGLFGSEKIPFVWSKYVGLTLMVGGMLLFKWKS